MPHLLIVHAFSPIHLQTKEQAQAYEKEIQDLQDEKKRLQAILKRKLEDLEQADEHRDLVQPPRQKLVALVNYQKWPVAFAVKQAILRSLQGLVFAVPGDPRMYISEEVRTHDMLDTQLLNISFLHTI